MKIFRFYQRGLSLVEVIIAMVVLVIVFIGITRSFLFTSHHTAALEDNVFAAQKAIQMLDELRGLVSSDAVSLTNLDSYNDGSATSPILTTHREVTNPADILSGNGKGKFLRRISVQSVTNEPQARRVYVRVFKAADMTVAAETMSVLRSLATEYNPSQVLDVYVIAIENVPGWWVALSTMKPMFDNLVQDLQIRNPGLEFRVHWISRLAYGRDPYYTPYVNKVNKTEDLASPYVYFYPGAMTKPGQTATFYYYVADYFAGRIRVDKTAGSTATEFKNQNAYPIADQYNNAVRYPDELRLYKDACDAADLAGNPRPEISLRMLLEQLNDTATFPKPLKNSLIVNLHGEMLPVPPMRNYSDAAKDPGTPANVDVRVVSHPENIRYNSGAPVNLRVYSYVMNPDGHAPSETTTMSVFVPGIDLTGGGTIIVEKFGDATPGNFLKATATSPGEYQVSYSNGGTLITLVNSPLRHPRVTYPGGGVDPSDRLYGLEYIPCPIGVNFDAVALSSQSTNANGGYRQPRNTARWIIHFQAGALDGRPNGMTTFETRIGTDLTEGTPGNKPENMSRTYVWVGVNPPVTERCQFMGDPRHMPYLDVKLNDGANYYFRDFDHPWDGSNIPSGYTNFPTGPYNGWTGYNGFTANENRHGSNLDVPRFHKLYREGLINSAGIYSSMTGWSVHYIGCGGDIGSDGNNGFPIGLTIVKTPWNPGSSNTTTVDEITPFNGLQLGTCLIAQDPPTSTSWIGLSWLGELYPDDQFAEWVTDGNLPTGSGNYYRASYSVISSTFTPYKIPGQDGASSFFNGSADPIANPTNTFTHTLGPASPLLTPEGIHVATTFNFPLANTVLANRPFTIDSNDDWVIPINWNDPVYVSSRTQLSIQESFYRESGGTMFDSALIRTHVGTTGADYGNFVINGLAPQANFGAAQISKLCLITLVRGFMTLGAVADDPIPQLPLITITAPTDTDQFINPTSIDIGWTQTWTRWNGALYTEAYTSYTGPTVHYNVKFSNDNGKTWTFVNGGTAQAGVYKSTKDLTSFYTWNVSGLAEGYYLIRVEGFRENEPLHYAYHQRQIYVQR